jgi:hypothetical protein
VCEKSEFLKSFNADSAVQPFREKYSSYVFRKNMIVSAPSRLGKRGGVANRHQTWARDAVDALASRVRFRTRTSDVGADAKSCGPDTPTLVSSARDDDLVRDGGKKARFPRESTNISVKTIAQGMPDDLAEPVVTAASFLICWRAMGEAVARHSLRPLHFEGGPRTNLSARALENADA